MERLTPVTTPEAYHLSVALAAVFILWASQPLSRRVPGDFGRTHPSVTAWVAPLKGKAPVGRWALLATTVVKGRPAATRRR
mgnify:CR=1 FL=1